MRRYGELSKDQEPLLPLQFCSDCITATRGYDFREGQDCSLALARGLAVAALPATAFAASRGYLPVQ
jgi:hypothetical protein